MSKIRQLIVSVDTEEEGLWGGRYRVKGNTTENLRGLATFQSECERLSVAPTYVIDAPVTQDKSAMLELRRWQELELCEVGAHCHPWCNPPLGPEAVSTPDTFLCNLSVETQYAKLAWLTEQIAEKTGRSPTSYRAGRYGFDASSAGVLTALGYQVDSSVIPLYEYRSQGGPDFSKSDRNPVRFENPQGSLLEIPVTTGFTRPGFANQRDWWTRLRRPPWTKLRAAGLADRLSYVRRVKLSPEGTRLSDLKRLVNACSEDGLETLVLMLHSTSLVEGFSPYAKTAIDLEAFYRRLVAIIKYAIETHGYRPVTLTQAARSLDSVSRHKTVPKH